MLWLQKHILRMPSSVLLHLFHVLDSRVSYSLPPTVNVSYCHRRIYQYKGNMPEVGFGKMDHKLRALTASAEDANSVLSTQFRWLIAPVIPSLWNLVLTSGLCGSMYSFSHIKMHSKS